MEAALEVAGLVKEYGPVTAVAGIDLAVPRGTVFAFLGPNGAGKTTTVEILEGLRKPTRGRVRVLGRDPWTDGPAVHRRVGVIPQDFHFFAKLTAREAIEYYGALFGTAAPPDLLLARVDLSDKIDARFDTLSGGQKQKLGLALALVNDPEVCFLDEPTTGLDPHARRSLWSVIRALKAEGRTVFLTTHYLEEAELLADRVAIIHRGHVIATGTPEEIIRAHGQPPRLRLRGPATLAEHLAQALGLAAHADGGDVRVELRDRHDVLRILAEADRSGLPWESVATEEDTLEDVFVRLVGRMDEGALPAEGGR